MCREVDFSVHGYRSREEIRRIVVSQFLMEEPGSGGGSRASKYHYYVETLSDGKRIYLTRPAILKKGFDFVINVEGTEFHEGRGGERPSFADIFGDLKAKRKSNPALSGCLHEAIERIYNCEDPDDIISDYDDLRFDVGHPVDLILKVIKWFFIEQDIRDWNYSGRAMFKRRVDDMLRGGNAWSGRYAPRRK